MSGPHEVVASRIERELADLGRVVARAERSLQGERDVPGYQDQFLDAAALNLHDFYAGLERMFEHIATTVDRSTPTGREWHRELLAQMNTATSLRPAVISPEILGRLQDYLGFRHVVRNVYAFQFDRDRIAQLISGLRPLYTDVAGELTHFAKFLRSASP